ncbi:hypothetical protein [Peribacillus sp. SI8-4]|uniref:hypothetical protein n=1 Tax=Peribacillus sp. SI8-4 TaxID=3048009 RepID=UPI00255288CD|nr:hypothetical protein [Peribacillus sp. SI8-4]
MIERPEKLRKRPEKVIERSEKLRKRPEKVIERSEKLRKWPEKAIERPEKVIERSEKLRKRPKKVIERLKNSAKARKILGLKTIGDFLMKSTGDKFNLSPVDHYTLLNFDLNYLSMLP